MSLVKIQGNASGTGTLTIAAPNTNSDRTLTLPDSTGTLALSGAAVARSQLPAGSVIQVVSTTFTSEFSWTTKGSWVDMTGISASITPTSVSNKIFVQLMLATGDGGNNYERAYRILRDSSVIAEGPNTANIMVRAQAATGMGAFSSNATICTIPIMVLDSPATTSSITYKLQGWASSSSVTTSYINRPYIPATASSPTGISTITLMEIAA